jgi:hypothetical protein
MYSIDLVTTALAAGARQTASGAIQDAYASLKSLARRRLAGHHAGEVALAELEHDPDTWKAPLQAQLQAAGAEDDAELVAAAQALMARLDTSGSRAGKYAITISGAQGVQVGDHNVQHNTFGPPPDR